MMDLLQASRAILLGTAVGDALGVPWEFWDRDTFCATDMERGESGYPAGTWSDDTALTLALADNLSPEKFDLTATAQAFVDWNQNGAYSPTETHFGIGEVTRRAIARIRPGVPPEKAGGKGERDNGNGSLMRIAPLAVYLADISDAGKRFEIVKKVSCITHAHPWSVAACFIFTEMMRNILEGKDKIDAYRELQQDFQKTDLIDSRTLAKFERLLKTDVGQYRRDEISGSGFVIDTLEAAFWCLLTTVDFKSAVLAAVNLGEDTDTTGAVAGALAGLYYGVDAIPTKWLETIAWRDRIETIAAKMKPLAA